MTNTDTPTILTNGATVLAYTQRDPHGNGFLRNGVALCHKPGTYDPFITWVIAQDVDSGEWHAQSGHYFQTITEATDDYRDRGGK